MLETFARRVLGLQVLQDRLHAPTVRLWVKSSEEILILNSSMDALVIHPVGATVMDSGTVPGREPVISVLETAP